MSEKEYWNKFYADIVSDKHLTIPSQFAAFFLGETNDVDLVIEFGCGNGRDSAFFARHGKKVIALDLSTDGISINKKKYSDISNLNFETCDVTKNLPNLGINLDIPKSIYARFFIHALQTDGIAKFFDNCVKLMSPRDKLFLEYRTVEDTDRAKTTSLHYRNFLRVKEVEQLLNACQLKTLYFTQGIGYAKWKDDDAFVARHIIGLAKND